MQSENELYSQTFPKVFPSTEKAILLLLVNGIKETLLKAEYEGNT